MTPYMSSDGKQTMAQYQQIKVSKIDASRRQLDCAIDLWFRDGDPVSIHTLVSAAFEIIQDLNSKVGNKEITMIEMARRLAKPEHVQQVMQLLRKPMAFFKHADRDPHAILEFAPEASEMLIVLAIRGLGLLGEQVTDLQQALINWHALHKPHIFLEGQNPLNKLFGVEQIAGMRQFSKREFFDAFLLGLAQGRIRR
jgi:hypothetical protein